jgi:hypothetical protein
MEEISVHDNRLVAYTVNSPKEEISFSTVYEDGGKVEHTDIIFRGVIAYYFTQDDFQTIIFDIEEVDPAFIVNTHKALFEEGQRYGWPSGWDSKKQSISEFISQKQVRGFEVSSSCGMQGWVLAREMEKKVAVNVSP